MSAFNKPAMPLNRRHALMFMGANAWAMRPAWADAPGSAPGRLVLVLSLIHISEPTRPY